MLTCAVFVAVLNALAHCCMDKKMFTEAAGLYQTQLSLLQERPEENRKAIAVG